MGEKVIKGGMGLKKIAVVMAIAVVVAVAAIGGYLLLRGGSNTYTMVAVSNSMMHVTENWRNAFLGRGYDSQTIASFPCQNGFERGDTLVFERYDPHSTTLNVGDIIDYKINDKDIFHRIVEIENNNQGLITMGDANFTVDNPISVNQVVGKLVSVTH
jgi:hypothetical protein